MSRPRERLLLVGAGHAHLHLLRSADALRAAGYEPVLVAPRWFDYSGTVSAVALGRLPRSAGSVDVARLARRHDVRHVVGRLTDLDVEARTATTDSGEHVGWDVCALNVGSVTAGGWADGHADVLPVKPLHPLHGLHERLVGHGRHARVTVVGGGHSGVELAAHCAAHPVAPRVRLLEGGPMLAPSLPAAARRRLVRRLARLGVDVRTQAAPIRVRSGAVELATGEALAHDVLLLATGLAPPAELVRWGVGGPLGVPVLGSLRHRDLPHVYASGDCADFLPGALARSGVHGVRQGPVLVEALRARSAGDRPPAYDPPRRYLSVVDLGGGRALAVRGRWSWEGRAAHLLKRRIDRRWLASYQE